MDCGIRESDFWTMTLAEINRATASWQRTQTLQAKEHAAFDYILAAMIGRNVANYFGEVTVPPIEEVYGHLFKEESEKVQETKIDKKTQLSALRFKQFAQAHNDKFLKS